MDNGFYRKRTEVKWHEIDFRQQLKASAFMNMAQDIANSQASYLKFGYDELIAINQVWVLSRIKVKFNRYPLWRDNLSLQTWHKGKDGLFGLRDFAAFIEETAEEKDSAYYQDMNNAAITATSSWLIINTNTRRIERNNLFSISPEIQAYARNINACGERCEKIKMPDNMNITGTHVVKYSDIDFNMHVNNAKYIDWIVDDIDMSILAEYCLSEFQLNYISEAKFGETIEIFSTINDVDKEFNMQFEGRRGDDVIFEANLLLRECNH